MKDAVRRRAAGESFDVSFEVLERRTAVARAFGNGILQQFPDHDRRRAAFAALAKEQLHLGGQPQNVVSVYDPAVLATMRDIAKLADRTVVHSAYEAEALRKLLEYRPRLRFATPHADFDAMLKSSTPGERVVVVATNQARESIAVILFGLAELRIPVDVVVETAAVAAAVSQARLIVDATPGHAGNALAIQACGVPLCCAVTSGATEYLREIAVYEPWDASSVYRAVTTALGMGPPQLREIAWPQEEVQELPVSGPLVTIGIRTFNRPDQLAQALDSIAAQTYRSIEAIVVNDAGPDVTHVVERYPFAELVTLEHNSGGTAGSNVALERARGAFIGFLDDDDVLFPDHIARLVAALQTSGGGAAHADTLSAFFERREGEYVPAGYSVFLDHPVEPTDFHVNDGIGPMSVLVRAEVARAVGGFDPLMPHAHDWEFYLKVSRACDIVHVPRVTAQYSIRSDASNMMQYKGKDIADAMERMIAELPLPDRPLVEKARGDVVRRFEAQAYSARFPSPPLRLE